jgi:predicted glycosyltransferase
MVVIVHGKKNILFDINHPAQVHLFKNLIYHFQNSHNVVLNIRDKDILIDLSKVLFDKININQIGHGHGFWGNLKALLIAMKNILKLNSNHDFHIMIGTSIPIALLTPIIKANTFNFNEDDDNIVPIYKWSVHPFATRTINPDCLKITNCKSKRVSHPSYHELAYLHPNNFYPDESLLKKYDLNKKNFVILRINSLKAYHDVGAKGISNVLYLKIKELLKNYTIIESRENSKTHQIEPWDMHHILAQAKMIISDSQTMTIEAAVLGVPAVRINSFIGKSTVIDELEQNKYKLAYGYYPNQEEEALKTIEYLAINSEVDNLWQKRRQIMLADKCDLNQWMIDYFEKEINK